MKISVVFPAFEHFMVFLEEVKLGNILERAGLPLRNTQAMPRVCFSAACKHYLNIIK
jgi:hypothetical protein